MAPSGHKESSREDPLFKRVGNNVYEVCPESIRPTFISPRWRSVLRSDTDAVTTTEAHPVSKKWVGKGGGPRCPSFFLVALTRENDSSHFSLFSSLPPCNAIFRFHAFGYRVKIENCISLDSMQKRREADDNFKFMKYVVQETTLFFRYFGKNLTKTNIWRIP